MSLIKFNVIVSLISSSEIYICSKFRNDMFAVMFYFDKGSDFKIKLNVQTWASLTEIDFKSVK